MMMMMIMIIIIIIIPSRCRYKTRPRESLAGRNRRLSVATVLNLN